MLIDPNPSSRGPANPQIPLSPELTKLVADLKLSLGQNLEALVTRVQVVTEAERQQLLGQQPVAAKNQAQQQLQALLQEPALKLVELKIQQHLVPTLTTLPLTKTQAVQVMLTPRGLMLVPPSPSPAGELPHRPLTTPLATTTAVVPATSNLMGAAQASAATSVQPPISKLTGPGVPVLAGSSGQAIIGAMANPHSKAKLSQIPTDQVRPLIAETLARALPQARELPPLLRAISEFNRQLATVPNEKLPPQVRELQTLLNKLPALSVNTAQLNPSQPQALRQALEQSGVFYERRLLQSQEVGADTGIRKLPEQDVKGLLIQIQQWLSTPTPPTPGRAAMPDALSQLLFGLVQSFLPRQKTRPNISGMEQLKSAVQQQVGQSLARIQTQQMRTLNNQLLDPETPQQWHLDIPLRFPEGYGNLYMHLFEPRLPPEPDRRPEKKEQRRQGKSRWRVFMELMLDELGGLAAEISVVEQDLEITLWTERDNLRERANAHLRELRQDLEQQGLVVRELQCSQQPPPAQKVRLDYALIDIKT